MFGFVMFDVRDRVAIFGTVMFDGRNLIGKLWDVNSIGVIGYGHCGKRCLRGSWQRWHGRRSLHRRCRRNISSPELPFRILEIAAEVAQEVLEWFVCDERVLLEAVQTHLVVRTT